MYEPRASDYTKELKKVENSITAYTNLVDCSNKTATQIESCSYKALEKCFEQIFFVETVGAKSFLKNTGRALGALTSLGGSYTLALQQKHYSDLYAALYKPSHNELKILQGKTNHELTEIGELLKRYKKIIVKVEKVLNKTPNHKCFGDNIKTTTLKSIRKFNNEYNATLTTGFGGLVGGSTALGAWGVVSVIGSASTGTAISTLSGAAATNATLAWFGGGSLAAGGTGMFGGFWVLGGIVAAPMIYFSTKSSYKKASAVKEEKFKIVSELEKFNKLKVDTQKHLEELIKQHKHVSKSVNRIAPELESALKSFKLNSSLGYRIFGGTMNERQKVAVKTLDELSRESLCLLGFI